MKRLATSFAGLLLVVYLSAAPTGAQSPLSQGRQATAHESESRRAASISKGEVVKPRPTTPGELLTQNKKLSDKLTSILEQQNPPVTDLQEASQGFRLLGVFVAAVHISQNLSIPFDQLKTQKQTSGTLGKAIHALRPDADVKAEIWKAAEQTVEDMRKFRLNRFDTRSEARCSRMFRSSACYSRSRVSVSLCV